MSIVKFEQLNDCRVNGRDIAPPSVIRIRKIFLVLFKGICLIIKGDEVGVFLTISKQIFIAFIFIERNYNEAIRDLTIWVFQSP